MIKDFFFVMRMLVITALIVIIAQVRLGEKTVEDHFHDWVKDSILVDYIDEAVDGGVKLFKLGYGTADSHVHLILAKISRKHPKKERGHFSLKRYTDGDQEDEVQGVQGKTQTSDVK